MLTAPIARDGVREELACRSAHRVPGTRAARHAVPRAGRPGHARVALALVLCAVAPVPSLLLASRSACPSAELVSSGLAQPGAQRAHAERGARRLVRLRGGAGPLKSSAVVNLLTGEAVDEVTVVDSLILFQFLTVVKPIFSVFPSHVEQCFALAITIVS